MCGGKQVQMANRVFATINHLPWIRNCNCASIKAIHKEKETEREIQYKERRLKLTYNYSIKKAKIKLNEINKTLTKIATLIMASESTRNWIDRRMKNR